MSHKTDGLLLIVRRYKLLPYLRATFIRRGDLTGVFLHYEFWGLVFGGVAHGWAYFRNFTVRDEHALNFGFFPFFVSSAPSVQHSFCFSQCIVGFEHFLPIHSKSESILCCKGVFDSSSREIRCFAASP